MNRRLNTRCAWLLLAAAQFGLMAHAVEFGAEAHEHAGAPCHLLFNEDADDVLGRLRAAFLRALAAAPASQATRRRWTGRLIDLA
ncbi:MAG: hypothetical protein AAFU65_12335, partial [Pseudomonadota bacterium]